MLRFGALLLVVFAGMTPAVADEADTSRGNRMLTAYFATQTAQLREAMHAKTRSPEDWKRELPEYRRQLREMLGLDPLPERTDLQAEVTGTVEADGFVVENLHFQSRPGLYVTGNLYRPREVKGRLPAVLYVCGHGGVKKNGISYGNKVHYHHHGAWFARNGYVCLIIDSLQLGEILATHHGLYRYDMWWWQSRGYTPAGVEAWNCVRALDYLQTRDEVDPQRLGVTGRSGGGAYSWWIAAIDERIKAAVPVAGITDLEDHVVDGCVSGHCDCMYMVNTYQWDYPLVAAVVAPRPLLISNTDTDRIFPLDGVIRTYDLANQVYGHYDAKDKVAVNISPGPHKDTQQLRVHAFGWFNHWLKSDDTLIDKPATRYFEPEQLKVFASLPADQRNTTIHETFVPVAQTPELPQSESAWNAQRAKWTKRLDERVFRAWPAAPPELDVQQAWTAEHNGVRLAAYDYQSQGDVSLRLYVASAATGAASQATLLQVLDSDGWQQFLAQAGAGFARQLAAEAAEVPPPDKQAFAALVRRVKDQQTTVVFVAPRGVGRTAWTENARERVQIRRRFYLLGQTLEGMQTWDIRRAIQAVRAAKIAKQGSLRIAGRGPLGVAALYAALYEPDIAQVQIVRPTTSHDQGPHYLNIRRWLDVPQAVALATTAGTQVSLQESEADAWSYPRGVLKQLGLPAERLSVE